MSYNGRRFNREQLDFVVGLILSAALDRIETALPATRDDWQHWVDTYKLSGKFDSWVQSAVETAGMGLAVLYAQLNAEGDGMGVGDAIDTAGFDTLVSAFIAHRIDAGWQGHQEGEPVTPDVQPFVDRFINVVFVEDVPTGVQESETVRGYLQTDAMYHDVADAILRRIERKDITRYTQVDSAIEHALALYGLADGPGRLIHSLVMDHEASTMLVGEDEQTQPAGVDAAYRPVIEAADRFVRLYQASEHAGASWGTEGEPDRRAEVLRDELNKLGVT